jgi:hypothetical protein
MTGRRAGGAEERDRGEADRADRDAADAVEAGSEPRTDRADGGAEAGRTVDVDDGRLRLPTDATPAETAAIAAAVGAHLRDEAAAVADAAAAGDDDGWDGRRWAFAGRVDALAGCPVRATDGTPTDAWTAMGRADRLRRL